MTAEPHGEPPGNTGPAALPGPEPDVHVLTVRRERGDLVTVHDSGPAARAAAARYARAHWQQIAGTGDPREVPAAPDGLDDPAALRIYFARHPEESYGISPAFLPPAPAPAGFRLDKEKARAFLGRALRRWAGTLAPGEGDGAGEKEDWQLPPGWNPQDIFAGGTDTVRDLVHQAVYEAGVIARPSDAVDLELSVQAALGEEWSYDWRVGFPASAGFALCAPCSEEYRRLGGFEEDGDPRAKGSRAALSILREAEARGNALLDAHAAGRGRVPVRRRPAGPVPGCGQGK